MSDNAGNWQQRVAAVWAEASDADQVLSKIDGLAQERPADDPAATYKRASRMSVTLRSRRVGDVDR